MHADLSKQHNSDSVPIAIYPFSHYHQFYDSLRISEHDAALLESETQAQRNSSRWWSERRSRLRALTFRDILSRKSIYFFLKGLVKDQDTSGSL